MINEKAQLSGEQSLAKGRSWEASYQSHSKLSPSNVKHQRTLGQRLQEVVVVVPRAVMGCTEREWGPSFRLHISAVLLVI